MNLEFSVPPEPHKTINTVTAGEVFTWGQRAEWYLKLENGCALNLLTYKVRTPALFSSESLEVADATLTIRAVK